MPVNSDTAVKEISKENRKDDQVVQYLQTELANAFVLYANYKHYHWQTFGPHFRDLHLMFDEFAAAVIASTDELAERLRMIGQNPINGLRRFEERASVQAAGDQQSMREMVQEADANLMLVIKNMRAAARAADDQDDPGTVDLFSKLVQIHEKHEWFLREILKKQDGLS